MRRNVWAKVAALVLSVAILVSGRVWLPVSVNAVSGILGQSQGVSSGPSLGDSGRDADGALGTSGIYDEVPGAVAVSSFEELKRALQNAADGLYLVLGGDIFLEGNIDVPANRKVTIDGLGRYSIDQVGMYSIKGAARTEITLKELQVVGRYNYGIIRSIGEYGKGIFDNVTYSGPQPYYAPAKHCEMVVSGGRYDIRKQTDGGYSASPEEFSQNAYVRFDGGITEITHALAERNENAVFFYENGDSGKTYLKVTNGAQVKVTTGNYVMYTGIGYIPIIIEKGSRLEVVAPAFQRNAEHRISNMTVADESYFSFKQSGTPYSGMLFYEMRVDSNLLVGPGSTFLYEGIDGFRLEGTATLDAPKLVSFYGSAAAFHSTTGQWNVKGVNAVNYWSDTANAAPLEDWAGNWPNYIWNTKKQAGHGVSIGDSFSFSGSGSLGVISGGDVSDALERSGSTLRQTLRFDNAAKRLVLGNLVPFEIEQSGAAGNGVYGNVECSDIIVAYRTVEDNEEKLYGYGLPLSFEGVAKPKGGSELDIVANLNGLRAALKVEALGTLELVAVPETIYYGRHSVPVSSTLYQWESCSLQDPEGQMLVRVSDSRGGEGGAWSLTVEATGQVVPGKALLPSSAMVFLAENGDEYPLSEAAVIHTQGKAGAEPADYELTWARTQGIMVKSTPGLLAPGEYATVLKWTIQAGPDA